MQGKILYVVVPCYNEQEVLAETSKRLREKFQTLIGSGKIDEKAGLSLSMTVQRIIHGRLSRNCTDRTTYFQVLI